MLHVFHMQGYYAYFVWLCVYVSQLSPYVVPQSIAKLSMHQSKLDAVKESSPSVILEPA